MAIFCLERLLVGGARNFYSGQEVLHHFLRPLQSMRVEAEFMHLVCEMFVDYIPSNWAASQQQSHHVC